MGEQKTRRDRPTWVAPAWVALAILAGLLACNAYAVVTGQGWWGQG